MKIFWFPHKFQDLPYSPRLFFSMRYLDIYLYNECTELLSTLNFSVI